MFSCTCFPPVVSAAFACNIANQVRTQTGQHCDVVTQQIVTCFVSRYSHRVSGTPLPSKLAELQAWINLHICMPAKQDLPIRASASDSIRFRWLAGTVGYSDQAAELQSLKVSRHELTQDRTARQLDRCRLILLITQFDPCPNRVPHLPVLQETLPASAWTEHARLPSPTSTMC